jgi:hypothetical protein
VWEECLKYGKLLNFNLKLLVFLSLPPYQEQFWSHPSLLSSGYLKISDYLFQGYSAMLVSTAEVM